MILAIIVVTIILFFIISMIIGEVCLNHMKDITDEIQEEKHLKK